MIGLRAAGTGGRLTAEVRPGERRFGTGAAQLGYFVALYRLGISPTREYGASLPSFSDPDDLVPWFEQFRSSCDEAANWLTTDALIRTGSLDITVLLESFEEYLNLPLWKQRHLLYEIWVLCATLEACEHAGWTVELPGLTRQNGTWVLSPGQAADPIATLHRPDAQAVTLDVWREPARQTLTSQFTPDVSISTPRPYVRDLLVIEAKDRYKMPVGKRRVHPGHDPLAFVSPGLGGDRDEALEDAMQRCRELVEDRGPQHLLVLTDAPPHPAADCPYSINFQDQVQAILGTGSRIDVASDWLSARDETWSAFQTSAGFRLAPLTEILAGPLTATEQK